MTSRGMQAEGREAAVSGLLRAHNTRRHVVHVYTYPPIHQLSNPPTLAGTACTSYKYECVAHSREKVRKSASARDSHARRICLKFPRESTRAPSRRRRSRVAREQQRGPRKFRPLGAGRARGCGAPKAATVFPAATLVKVSDYRKNVCTISPPCSPCRALVRTSSCLLFLNGVGLDRFLLSPPRTAVLSAFLTKANARLSVSLSLSLFLSLSLSFSQLVLLWSLLWNASCGMICAINPFARSQNGARLLGLVQEAVGRS